MRCPTLSELPPPPPGRTGWPWAEESPQLPDTMPDGSPWPRVSIVTPSYNQAQFIEETIRSVLLQGYPDLEYIIIDGGSTDGSVEIIRKYEPWLAYWVSEPDRGQSHAINKGFARATGEICAWLNSDDVYVPGAVSKAAYFLSQYPECALVYGDCDCIDQQSNCLSRMRAMPFDLQQQLLGNLIPQPTAFLRAAMLQSLGALDESLHYVMDYELWLRIGSQWPVAHMPDTVLARFRLSGANKTVANPERFGQEMLLVFDRFYLNDVSPHLLKVKDQAYGRVSWLTGLAFLDRGGTREGTAYCKKAEHEHNILQSDPRFAIYTLIYTQQIPSRPRPEGCLRTMLGHLGHSISQVAKMQAFIWAEYRSTVYFQAYEDGDLGTVRRLAVMTLLAKPCLFLNQGFWSIWFRSCLAPFHISAHRPADPRQRV